MKIKTLEEILKKKSSKTEFAILTNLQNGDSEIYLPGTIPKGEFSKYAVEICLLYTSPSPRDYAASRMPSSA